MIDIPDGLTIIGNPVLPYAHVVYGGNVLHTAVGFTRYHAIGRAVKWAMNRPEFGVIYFPRR